MKTIEVSDEDYKILMELSKELQTQDNNSQAFPYFWEPSSTKRTPNYNGEGEYTVVIVDGCERTTPEDIIGEHEELWSEFCIENECDKDIPFEDIETDWIYFIDEKEEYMVYTEDNFVEQEHNPSLFQSDVKNFVKCNPHHLGEEPHTYSRTIWRMPKMESLVKAVLRMNKEHSEEVNHEAKRFLDL